MVEKACIIALVNLVFYFKTLKLGYVSDDLPVFHNPPESKNRWQFRWQQLIGSRKVKPQQDHLMTMMIHMINCILIYFAFGANNISFLAALLYTVSPSNNQGSVWISGRGYTLPAMGLLLTSTFPLAAPVFLFTVCWWTVGYLSPLVFLANPAMWPVLLWIPVMMLTHRNKFFTAIGTKHSRETAKEDRKFHWRKIVVGIKTLGFYFSLCLFPFRLSFYHSYMQSMAGNEIMRKRAYTLKDKFLLIGLIPIGLFIYFLLFTQWSMALWGLGWFLIAIAPFCNVVRCNQEIAERFTYIPNIGLMVALAYFLSPFPILATAILTMYAVRMYIYYRSGYVDDYWIVEVGCAEDPSAWYVWHMRGHKRLSQGAMREALNMWTMAKLISPKEFKVLLNIGSILKMMKKDKEADKFLERAERNVVEGQEKQAAEVIKAAKEGKGPIII